MQATSQSTNALCIGITGIQEGRTAEAMNLNATLEKLQGQASAAAAEAEALAADSMKQESRAAELSSVLELSQLQHSQLQLAVPLVASLGKAALQAASWLKEACVQEDKV